MTYELPRDTLVAIVEEALKTLDADEGSTIPARIRAVASTAEAVYFGDMYSYRDSCGCPLVQAEVLDEEGKTLDPAYGGGFFFVFDSMVAHALDHGPDTEGLVRIV